MKKLLCAILSNLFAVVSANAQAIDGNWQGTLKSGDVEIRVVVHLVRDERGGLRGTLDSPDQGATGIPITTAVVADSTLKLDVQAIQGSFEGKINTEATAIAGTWTQLGRPLPLELTRAAAATVKPRVAKPSDIDGDWDGTLETPGGKLQLVLHVTTYEDGMTAKLDSPDQRALGLPVTAITREAATVRFEMKQLAGSFTGTLDTELSTLTGVWTQLNMSLPLVLKRIRK